MNQRQYRRPLRVCVLRLLVQNLAGTLQSGERFGHLRADVDDLHASAQ